MTTNTHPAQHGRFLVRLTLMLLTLFSLAPPAQADIIRVGVYENGPKIFTDPSGKPAGIYVDLIEYIAQKEGWHLRYVPGTFKEDLERLEKGEIDLMPDVSYTAERTKICSFHTIPALTSWFQVFAPKGNKIKTLLDLNGKRLLVLDGSIQQEAFDRLSKGFGLNTTVIPAPDYQSMFKRVAQGDADAAVTNSFYGALHAKEFGLEDTAIIFEPSNLFFATPKGDPQHLLEAIDRHLAELKKDPQSPYYTSLKHWTSEQVRFNLPPWLRGAGLGGLGFLIMSLIVSAILKHQVNRRTRELQQENAKWETAQQRLLDIIEFLPDPTFVIDNNKRVIAWNQSCETMTGVSKDLLLGQEDYAYAEPFFGRRRPMLIDLLDQPEPEAETIYTALQRKDDKLYAEFYSPHLRAGQGAHLWGIASPLFDRDGNRCGAIETVRDVTEQKQMEAALRASEQEYRELVMLANSIILRWSPEGRITFLNEFGQRFFGYSAAEIVGQHVVGTIVPESESQGRDLRSLMQAITANPKLFERNINENMRRNGDRVWIDWTNKVVADEQGQIREILSIGSDITERKQAEERIRQLNQDLQNHADTLEQRVAERTAALAAMNEEQRTIFESAGTGIVLLRNRVIRRCNRKMEEIIGYDPGELAGQSTRIWYPDEQAYLTSGENHYVQMAKGETCRQELQMKRKDGSLVWVRVSLRAFDPNDPLAGAVGIIEDITDEREAAEALRRAMEAAQAADRLKSAFLATMSHELRTPLNSIIGFTGIMLQGLAGPLNDEQHKQLAMVQNSSRHLLALINDVLDISKIEAGQFELVQATFALRPSLEKAITLIAPLAEQKGIQLGMDIAEDVDTLTSDQRRFEQVLLNLLSNAIKFTDQGQVRLACRLEKGQYLLSVTDTGIGIRPEDIPNLFQPFHQLDIGLTRKHEGTGLGLSICKKIVELMGGVIEVQSQWGVGTTFTVCLPCRQGELS
jgi:PAS domain S-box-containing protein